MLIGLQELEQIETVWEITKDWEAHWDNWKNGRFSELQTKEMEELSNANFKKLNKMSRELKVRVNPSCSMQTLLNFMECLQAGLQFGRDLQALSFKACNRRPAQHNAPKTNQGAWKNMHLVLPQFPSTSKAHRKTAHLASFRASFLSPAFIFQKTRPGFV